MKFLKKVGLILTVLAVALVLIGFMLPERVHIERSLHVAAPPTTVFPYVNDLRQFNRWSPWAQLDPNTRYTFEGPNAGKGATMRWASDDGRVGNGSQEIIASLPDRRVETRLDFGDGGAALAFHEISVEADGSRVTWGFESEFGSNLIARYFGLMFDRMIGPDYEKGLKNLKLLVEAQAAAPTP